MEVKIIKKSGVPVLRMEVNLYQFLEENFDEINAVFYNRRQALKELYGLYKENPEVTDELIRTMRHSRDTEEVVKKLGENLSMSKKTARYLMSMSFRDMTSLSVASLECMLDR